jgi:excisionase family DNA binding protein
MADEKLYTASEVAFFLRVTPEGMRKMLRDGKIKGFLVGQEWRIRRQDVHDFVCEHANAKKYLRDDDDIV